MTSPLLDPPPIAPARLARLEEAVADLLETRLDVVLPQAEAVLPLEAAARSLGREGVTALNLDTFPYGAVFGRWLKETGADRRRDRGRVSQGRQAGGGRGGAARTTPPSRW